MKPKDEKPATPAPNPETQNVMARYDFTGPELIELGREAGRERSNHARLESEFNSIKSDYKGKMEACEARMDNCFAKSTAGFEMREVEAVVIFGDPKPGQKALYKADREAPGWKGDFIRSEEMTKADFQLELIRVNPPVEFDKIKTEELNPEEK